MHATDWATDGYVVLQFDVTSDGLVANPVVIETTNIQFNTSALRSIARWRYAAQFDEDGNPVSVCDQTARIDFHWEW